MLSVISVLYLQIEDVATKYYFKANFNIIVNLNIILLFLNKIKIKIICI